MLTIGDLVYSTITHGRKLGEVIDFRSGTVVVRWEDGVISFHLTNGLTKAC
jgi:hypothetical protein